MPSKTTFKRPSKKKPAASSRKPLVRTLIAAGIFAVIGLAIIYQVSDRPTREKIQVGVVNHIVDPIRDTVGVPDWMGFGLDAWVDSFSKVEPSWIPLTKPLSTAHRKYLFGGIPNSKTRFHILQNNGYMVGYDEKRKNPAWVAFRLFQTENAAIGPRPSDFKTDARTEAKVTPTDYSHSGYDRGHMAPNYAIARCYGKDAQLQTFLMSNIAPQLPNLNRGPWKNLEHRQAQRMAQRLGEVWIIVGPIYNKPTSAPNTTPNTSTHLPNGIEIPIAFFNIIVEQRDFKIRSLAFIMPQRVTTEIALSSFLTTIDQIESLTNLDFFNNLPAPTETHFESLQAPWLW